MIPGHRLNAIFCVIRLQHATVVQEILQEDSVKFLNKIITILHHCAQKWDGWANKQEGDKYIITWTLPEIDESDNEKNESFLEERTERADKSWITAVKIISEMRRASNIN